MTQGTWDERDLVRRLWRKGFAVLRAPASGASTRMPRPDIIAGHSGRGLQFAIEVKTTHKNTLYIPHKSVSQLIEFADRFGCQPLLAVKFKGRGVPWLFLDSQHLAVTPSLNFKITLTEALQKGMDLTALMQEGSQTRLSIEGETA